MCDLCDQIEKTLIFCAKSLFRKSVFICGKFYLPNAIPNDWLKAKKLNAKLRKHKDCFCLCGVLLLLHTWNHGAHTVIGT